MKKNMYSGCYEQECSYASYNMNVTMPYVHYSDDYWNKARTVWGVEEKNLNYDYSDRLYQWDYDKAEKSFDEATKQCGNELPLQNFKFI